MSWVGLLSLQLQVTLADDFFSFLKPRTLADSPEGNTSRLPFGKYLNDSCVLGAIMKENHGDVIGNTETP